jgi:hypothetical protein
MVIVGSSIWMLARCPRPAMIPAGRSQSKRASRPLDEKPRSQNEPGPQSSGRVPTSSVLAKTCPQLQMAESESAPGIAPPTENDI